MNKAILGLLIVLLGISVAQVNLPEQKGEDEKKILVDSTETAPEGVLEATTDFFRAVPTAADSLTPKAPYGLFLIDYVTFRKDTLQSSAAFPTIIHDDWYNQRDVFGARGKLNWLDSLPSIFPDVLEVLRPIEYVGDSPTYQQDGPTTPREQ